MNPSKKILIFIVFIALVGFAVYTNKSTVTPIEELPSITGEESADQTFTGSTFSFDYPKDLNPEGNMGKYSDYSWRLNAPMNEGVALAMVTIPKSIQPNTNLSDSRFTVGASTDAQAIKNCLIATNGEAALGESTIDGLSYKKFELADAAAGNRYDTISYRIIHDNACYAIEYTIHSTAIDNYPPELGIKEFDRTLITSELERMVQSFGFL